MNFLVVEDHEVVRQGLKDILAREFPNCRVVEAANSDSALARLREGGWQLVVLDINLPGKSGLELVVDARQLCPAAPVLVLSAYPEESFALRALQVGASAYLNKQSSATEIVAAVRKILSGGRYLTSAVAERLADRIGENLRQMPHESLSAREMVVMQRIAAGASLKEIAAELSLAETTIATYRVRIYRKLGVASNVELSRYAVRHKLVE